MAYVRPIKRTSPGEVLAAVLAALIVGGAVILVIAFWIAVIFFIIQVALSLG